MNKYAQFSQAKVKRSCLGHKTPKTRYPSEAHADLVKNYPRGGHRRPVRSYKCPVCGSWHITSRSA